MINSILLIRPYTMGKMEFPFGLLYVGTSLKKRGYSVKIIDLHENPDREPEVEETLFKNPNTLLGISSLSGSYCWVKELTLRLKEEMPDLPIVIGGHISISYELLLKKTGVDYVCLGEGEEMLPNLIEKINNNGVKEDVPGLAYQENGEIIRTNIKLLKEFIIPDFSLIEINKYLPHPTKDKFFAEDKEYQLKKKDNDKLGAIMFSRGCMGACGFCYRHLPGYRQGSIEWCWKLIMKLYQDYGVRYFRVDDELFTSNKEWFEKLYQKIIESDIKILFRVTGLRVDGVNDEILTKLKRMGCIAINYGIESGSQKILDNMNKMTTVEQNRQAIQKTLEHGIQVMAYIMFGYEGETRETLKETLSLLLETDLNPGYISLSYTIPLPGTRLYFNSMKKGLIKNEEKFLEITSTRIYNQYERYILQLGDVTRDELYGFEKKFFFLLYLKRVIPKNSLIFKMIYNFTLFIPYDSKLNRIFVLGQKISKKIYNFLNEK